MTYQCQMKKDGKGKIIEKIEQLGTETHHWRYEYDEAGRLARADDENGLICMCHYDNQGRRYRDGFSYRDPRNAEYRYTTDNRLTAMGNIYFYHDDNGFRCTKGDRNGETKYHYAPDYRLQKVELPDGRIFTYEHYENGQRAAKLLNGQLVEAYKWKDFTRLDAFFDGQSEYKFHYQGDERVPSVMSIENQQFRLYADQVGTIKVIADQYGNVVRNIKYDPFGNIITDSTPSFRFPLGFAGGLHDPDTGFIKFGFRDYDSVTCRWTPVVVSEP